MDDFTFLLIKIVVVVAVTLTTRYLIPVLKSYAQNNLDKRLYEAIQCAVKAAEQTVTGAGKGSEKKEIVVNYMECWLNNNRIHITQQQLDFLIEECVYLMNHSK